MSRLTTCPKFSISPTDEDGAPAPGETKVNIASRLRSLRRAKRINQSRIASSLGLSVSEISRIERGRRRLRVDQLRTWAQSLGYRVELVFWETGEDESDIDDSARAVLQHVVAAIQYMPAPARQALIHEMNLWRQEAAAK
jgi:transcriptional regulator with XRE-family HTH domain